MQKNRITAFTLISIAILHCETNLEANLQEPKGKKTITELLVASELQVKHTLSNIFIEREQFQKAFFNIIY